MQIAQIAQSTSGRIPGPSRRRTPPRIVAPPAIFHNSAYHMVKGLHITRNVKGVTISGKLVNRWKGELFGSDQLGLAQAREDKLSFTPPKENNHVKNVALLRGTDNLASTEVSTDGTFRIETKEIPPGEATLLISETGPGSYSRIGIVRITIPGQAS